MNVRRFAYGLSAVPLVAFAAASAFFVACGSDGPGGETFPTHGDDASTGDDGGASDDGGGMFGDAFSSGDSANGDASCAATTAKAEKPVVDIIFVIDDSGSMTEEMVQIKTNVNSFATKIGMTGLDYRVIFIVKRGTSGNTICVPPPLGGAACADNPPHFYHVNQDVQSNNSLSLILSTYDSTNTALAWNKYLRPESYKVFVQVTDDQATGTNAAQFDPDLLAKAPAGMFGTATKRKYIYDSIVGWTTGSAFVTGPKCSTAVNNGSEYQKLSQLTGGIIDSVCLTDYSGVLDNLAKGIATKLGCEFAMPQPDGGTADPTKIVVQYTPGGGSATPLTQVTDSSKCSQVPDGWYYDDDLNPTKIILCTATCTTVAADSTGKIDVLLGCKAPPPH